jgi:hypothetical protein
MSRRAAKSYMGPRPGRWGRPRRSESRLSAERLLSGESFGQFDIGSGGVCDQGDLETELFEVLKFDVKLHPILIQLLAELLQVFTSNAM